MRTAQRGEGDKKAKITFETDGKAEDMAAWRAEQMQLK